MKTYQDLLFSESKEQFISDAINDFKSSYAYRRALLAQKYYFGENPTIFNRMKWFWDSTGHKTQDTFKANNHIASEFFGKIIKQENSYLFSNGVNLNDENEVIKSNLDKNFDSKIFKAGGFALVDGVSWLKVNIINTKMNIEVFRGTEFIPILDERTGEIMAGIRFWQLETDKPVWIEFYEIDGVEEYKMTSSGIEMYSTKKPYRFNIIKTMEEETIESIGEYSRIPIFPLYGTENKSSTLTEALQSKIDAYDLVASDFINNLEDSEEVYWVLKNYGGQNLDTFLKDFKRYKTIKVDEDGDARPETLDIPHEARKIILETLKKDIFDSAMALNTEELTGSSLTTTAIKASMMNLDLKTDIFESNALSCLNQMFEFYLETTNQDIGYNIELIRRGLVNDSELINDIYTFREDISRREALRLNPQVPNERIDQILKEIEEEGSNIDFENFEIKEKVEE